MVLPLIPVAVVAISAAAGGTGLFTGKRGVSKIRRARSTAASGQSEHDAAVIKTNEAVDRVNVRIAAFGRRQEDAHTAVVKRMVRFLEQHAQQVRQSPQDYADGAAAGAAEVPHVPRFADPVGWAAGAFKAGTTGAAAYAGVPVLVASWGTASTGAAISGLSGAAAESATLAWLGGGAISSGGLGVAGGVVALNAAAVGPAMLVGGLALNGHGQKALTRATEYAANVQISCASQAAFRSLLEIVVTRVNELDGILERLASEAEAALERLEKTLLESPEGTSAFQEAMALVAAVREIITAPILDEAGVLNTDTEDLVIRYRRST